MTNESTSAIQDAFWTSYERSVYLLCPEDIGRGCFCQVDLTLSYRNQSIELLCKLMDWFLYDRDLHHERVNWLYFYWYSQTMLVVIPKSSRDCMTLIFTEINFWRVLPQNNLDSVKRASITGLKNNNFVQIWHLSLNLSIFEIGRIQPVGHFQS